MKIIYLSVPAIILLDIYLWTWISGLLTAPSDLTVFAGILSIFVIVILHYAFFKLFKSKF
ncbi:hypothetical protein [Chitinophaga rhizophila]|uniref:Uncharacterized protein n=1 Tax=Chitinophaga rhizophila TaxID=2866212 RepID=A0ABS7GIL6_9BACT|nr:hypothetical protein [Chitinophaga rhizophila]MBW8687513.1 hypothetical protein [Chitinophaga rhizophila]